jgi:hypothetical protein
MDILQSHEIQRMISRLGDHFRSHISNQWTRPVLFQLPLDKETWDRIEILTERLEADGFQSMPLGELYRQIAAVSRFIALVQKKILPELRSRMGSSRSSGSDRIMRDMVVSAFPENLQSFIVLLKELYLKVQDMDKGTAKRPPVYLQTPEIADIDQYLLGKIPEEEPVSADESREI